MAEVAGILEFCTEFDKLIRRVKARNPTTDLRDYFVALDALRAAMHAAVKSDRRFTIFCGTQLDFGDFDESQEFGGIEA